MRLQILAFLVGVMISTMALAQTELPFTLKTETGNIEGTLLLPAAKLPVPVALIIAGSGPTDRDGNNPMMTNNSLKMLATELANKGIASLRYDKRGIATSKSAGPDEKELRFETYIDDAKGWVNMLKKDNSFNHVIVVGHSEGSLIGMVVAQDPKVSKFVSIAGAGEPAADILREQMKDQPAALAAQADPIIAELVKGNTVDNVSPFMNSLFRPSVQPYLISWFKYDPQAEIAKLKKPVLVVQGTTDINVSVNNANRLHNANPDSKLVLIEGMNHILKNADADRTKNMLTYRKPDLPVNEELINAVSSFILTK